jgi:hypothetical protein
MDAALRKYCEQRKSAMLAERGLYERDWRSAAEYIDPYAGRFLTKQQAKQLPSRSKVINSHAAGALRTMDAGFMGGHTSKSRPWFRITTTDPNLADQQDVKAWLDDVAQRIRDVLAKSNFYTALPNFYHFRHLFGVALMACVEDVKDVVRFYNRSIGTYAIALDARGLVDSVWYEYERSAKQLAAQYPVVEGKPDPLPVNVRQAAASGKGDQRFMVQTLIEPNPDHKPGIQGAQGRAYRQIYWLDGDANAAHGCLEIGGEYDNPMLCSRWQAHGNDAYGTSPALEALGDIKQLQYLEGEKLRLTDLMSKPPLALPDYLRNKGASLNPGERIYLTPMQTQQAVEPIYTPDPRGLMQVQAEIDKVQGRIDRVFFADLFRMLDFLDDRQRTAYEISERKEEKVAMLGPALESLTDEVLDPVISRVYGIMERNNLLPPPPDALNGIPVNIEYTSMLAQAQKAAGLGTIERTIGFVATLAQATGSADVFDKVDLEQAIDEYADRQGAPARIIRSDEDVAAIKQGKAQQAQMAQMAAMAPAMKDAAMGAKALAEAVPQDGSMAQSLADAAA